MKAQLQPPFNDLFVPILTTLVTLASMGPQAAREAHRRAGRLDEAEAELREALRLVPGGPRTHVEMALLLEARGDIAGAVEHLRTALVAWETADEDYEPARAARRKLAELQG